MKKLLFDLVATQPNASGKRHGGGKYGEIIFFRMIERGIKFDCFYDSRKWINPEVKNAAVQYRCKMHDIAANNLADIINKEKYENLYSPLPSNFILNCNLCNVIVTLHGLRGLETPIDKMYWNYPTDFNSKVKWMIQKFAYKLWFKKQYRDYARYFDGPCKIITVSDHTRASIKSYFPYSKKEIKVFYSPNTSASEPVQKDTDLGRYFLMVSGNRWEKNNLRAILAFDKLVSAGLIDGMKTIVTGCVPGMFDKIVKNPSYFEFLGYIDEKKLNKLYANAYCLVYPSLNEGFGYPPLEAMRYGVPVIASPLSSISELLEGGALYFNPFSIEEIMSRMLLISDPVRYEHYSKTGYEKYQVIKQRQIRDLDLLIDFISGS